MSVTSTEHRTLICVIVSTTSRLVQNFFQSQCAIIHAGTTQQLSCTYLFEETLSLAKNVFELRQIKEVAFQCFGVRVDLFHLVFEFFKRRLNERTKLRSRESLNILFCSHSLVNSDNISPTK